jgi:hypothetical protein
MDKQNGAVRVIDTNMAFRDEKKRALLLTINLDRREALARYLFAHALLFPQLKHRRAGPLGGFGDLKDRLTSDQVSHNETMLVVMKPAIRHVN